MSLDRQPYVHVVHAPEDQPYVEQLTTWLTTRGVPVGPRPAPSLFGAPRPTGGLEGATAVVVVVSDSSASVEAEMLRAEALRKPVFVLVRSGTVPEALRQRPQHDVRHGGMPSPLWAREVWPSRGPVFDFGGPPTPRRAPAIDRAPAPALARNPVGHTVLDLAPAGREIFICYRRDDSAGSAGRLYDALVARFGATKVFFDTDSVDGGEDFVAATTAAVRAARVVLVVIGPRWLALGRDGRLRLSNPDDHVRREIEAAKRFDRRIIPVVVEGAPMPTPGDLPAELAWLTRINAVRLDHTRFHADVTNLLNLVGG